MCGIAGIVRRDGPIGDVDGLAASLGAALAHRGPDGAGSWCAADRAALLVHRRLAIIDLTAAAAQPMATADDAHVIVFNGEIYNHRELRRELESGGARFFTDSDTEVLLRLIVQAGPASLARVRGMFALAVWNVRDRTLLLARDRFGIKPLYVAASANHIAFASELGALRRAGLIDGAPSAAGVMAFLSWGSVPAPLTWQHGAEMLEPGTWRAWSHDGRSRRGEFADVRRAYHSDERRPPATRDVREAVGDAVRDSVRAHLVADVPVGVFLSGGIDSSAIVSAAASVGATNLQTFTVGFDDATSESAIARATAAEFGTVHHDLRISVLDVGDDLPRMLGHLDQPTIDGVNSFYVAKAVAATGIKAVLSGAGGDELFGGYPSFTRLPRALAIKRAFGPLWPVLAPLGAPFVPQRLQARWRWFAATNGRLVDAYRTQRGFLMPQEISALAGPALRDAAHGAARAALDACERERMDSTGRETEAAAIARLESRMYLSSQLLRDTDAMSMAHGLEVRLPFVDHTLLDTVWPALGAHPSLMRNKQLLWDTLEKPLPAAVVDRPKQGFVLPFATWMRGELAPVVRGGMQQLADDGWVVPDAPDRVWHAWRAGAVHWSRPWGLAVLGHFLAPS